MFDVCAPIAVSKSSSYIHNTRRVSVPTADEARAPKSDSLSDEGIEGRLARPRKWMASVYTKDRHLGIYNCMAIHTRNGSMPQDSQMITVKMKVHGSR
jgi:hypothetical protein